MFYIEILLFFVDFSIVCIFGMFCDLFWFFYFFKMFFKNVCLVFFHFSFSEISCFFFRKKVFLSFSCLFSFFGAGVTGRPFCRTAPLQDRSSCTAAPRDRPSAGPLKISLCFFPGGFWGRQGSRTRTPEKPKSALWAGHGLEPRPQFHGNDTQRQKKERNLRRERENKREILGPPSEAPTLRAVPPAPPTLQVPILGALIFSGFLIFSHFSFLYIFSFLFLFFIFFDFVIFDFVLFFTVSLMIFSKKKVVELS